MAKKLTPPAVHNMVRSAFDTPEEVSKALIKSYLSHPPFSYRLLGDIIRLALKGNKLSKPALDSAVLAHQKNPDYQKIFLEITPLIFEHFSSISPKFILDVEPRKYKINRIEIPFKPPFAFGVGDEIIIPWFIFWKNNPLTSKQLSLLATIISDLMSQDPDYRDAKIQIYDFGVGEDGETRTLQITDLATIKKLGSQELEDALLAFLNGYEMAEARIKSLQVVKESRKENSNKDQIDLFDDPKS